MGWPFLILKLEWLPVSCSMLLFELACMAKMAYSKNIEVGL